MKREKTGCEEDNGAAAKWAHEGPPTAKYRRRSLLPQNTWLHWWRTLWKEPSKIPLWRTLQEPPSPLAVVLLLLFCCCYLLLLFRCCCSATVCTVKRDGDARKYSPHIEVREVPGPPMITPPWKRRWNGVFRKRPLHWRRRCEENTSEWTCCIKSHSTVPKTTQLWRWKAHEGTHLLHHRHYSPLIKLTVNFTPYRW